MNVIFMVLLHCIIPCIYPLVSEGLQIGVWDVEFLPSWASHTHNIS